MRFTTLASAAVLGLSTAALAGGIGGSPQTANITANSTTNNTVAQPDTMAPVAGSVTDNSTDTSATPNRTMPDATTGTTGNKM